VPNPAAAGGTRGALRRAAARLQPRRGARGAAAEAAAKLPAERLELLKGLSGYVRPYDLLALMGEPRGGGAAWEPPATPCS
jgi:hypothetical protein